MLIISCSVPGPIVSITTVPAAENAEFEDDLFHHFGFGLRLRTLGLGGATPPGAGQ